MLVCCRIWRFLQWLRCDCDTFCRGPCQQAEAVVSPHISTVLIRYCSPCVALLTPAALLRYRTLRYRTKPNRDPVPYCCQQTYKHESAERRNRRNRAILDILVV